MFNGYEPKPLSWIFKDDNDMDETELKKAFYFWEKIINLLCLLGYHSIVDDDGDIFCLYCHKKFKSENSKRKDNKVTEWIKNKFYWVAFSWRDLNDPYRDY